MDLQCENRDDVTLAELEWIHMHKTAPLLRVYFFFLSNYLSTVVVNNISSLCLLSVILCR